MKISVNFIKNLLISFSYRAFIFVSVLLIICFFSFHGSISHHIASWITNKITESLSLSEEIVLLYKPINLLKGIKLNSVEILIPGEKTKISIKEASLKIGKELALNGIKIDLDMKRSTNSHINPEELVYFIKNSQINMHMYNIDVNNFKIDSVKFDINTKKIDLNINKNSYIKMILSKTDDEIMVEAKNLPGIPYEALFNASLKTFKDKLLGEFISVRSNVIESIDGQISINTETLTLSNLVLKLHDSPNIIYGNLNFNLKNRAVNLEFDSEKILFSQLTSLWAPQWAPIAFQWCSEHIKTASIENTYIKYDSIKNSLLSKGNIENGIIHQYSNYTDIDEIKGQFLLKDSHLKVKIDNAQMNNIKVHQGDITIDNLGNVDLTCQASSSIKELYKEYFKSEPSVTLTGDVKTKLQLFLSKDSLRHIIDCNFINVAIPDMLNFHKGTLKIHIKDKKPTMEGLGYIGNDLVQIKLLDDKNIVISGYIHPKEFKIPSFVISDKIDSEIVINYIDKSFYGNIKADNIPIVEKLGWHDKNNGSVTANFKGMIDKSITMKEINIKSKDFNAIGSANFYKNETLVDFKRITAKNTDIQFTYKCENTQCDINVFGQKAMLKKLNEFSLDSMNFDSNMDKALSVKLNIRNAYMLNDVIITNLLADFNGLKGYLKGQLPDDGYISLISDELGLEIKSNDAGLLLSGLNITNSLKKGLILLHANPKNSQGISSGMVFLTNFYLKKAPILAQLLSLSSLKGIVDILNGDGIFFNKLNAMFNYKQGIVDWDESWIKSDYLGISFKGTIDLYKQQADISGELVPIYIINKIAARIPLIGTVLSANNENGIIASTYSLKGTQGDYKIDVDRLSILTPRILQKFFNSIAN